MISIMLNKIKWALKFMKRNYKNCKTSAININNNYKIGNNRINNSNTSLNIVFNVKIELSLKKKKKKKISTFIGIWTKKNEISNWKNNKKIRGNNNASLIYWIFNSFKILLRPMIYLKFKRFRLRINQKVINNSIKWMCLKKFKLLTNFSRKLLRG